jgi:hypothetical protein
MVACVCRLLPLIWLAPDILQAILDARQPKGLRAAEMLENGGWRSSGMPGFLLGRCNLRLIGQSAPALPRARRRAMMCLPMSS